MTLSRRAFFSAGRRLWNERWDDETNRATFGRDVLPHGHEYTLQATFTGPVSKEDGIIVNLTEIKPIISAVVAQLDDHFLSAESPILRGRQPTAENLATFIWAQLPAQVGPGTLWRIKLQESRRVCIHIQTQAASHAPDIANTNEDASINATDTSADRAFIMTVLRSYEFAAAHRLHSPHLSEPENLRRFDKCSNFYGHGHNFGLDVVVRGEPHPETGFVILPQLLDRIVDEEVFTRFDHKHLNLDCPEFEHIIPSSENLATIIFDVLQARLNGEGYALARVTLHETQKNSFEVEA